jgi:hypothetical protein
MNVKKMQRSPNRLLSWLLVTLVFYWSGVAVELTAGKKQLNGDQVTAESQAETR